MLKHSLFRFFEKYFKIHLLPVHYYSPVPCVTKLDSKIFSEINSCDGLNMNDQKQIQFLDFILASFASEFVPIANIGLSRVDSFILYAMIRANKPKKMIEIGSGESTFISLEALSKNRSEGSSFIFHAIEPYPNSKLLSLSDSDFNLIISTVQDVSASFIIDADLLFIDSSHVSKIGSDVNYEILKLLPLLKIGAFVHWHDIMIPTDYPKHWIDKGTFWNESYMVHSFMLFNSAYEIVWASRYMQIMHESLLTSRMNFFTIEDLSQQLSSFWIRRIN